LIVLFLVPFDDLASVLPRRLIQQIEIFRLIDPEGTLHYKPSRLCGKDWSLPRAQRGKVFEERFALETLKSQSIKWLCLQQVGYYIQSSPLFSSS